MTTAMISRLGPADWEAFRAIRLESLARAPHVFGTALHQEIDKPADWWRDRLSSPDLGVHAAMVGDESVGMAGWMLPAAANARHRAYVWGVYVRDALRGGGIGRRLVAAAVDDAASCSEAIDLHVLVGNTPAVRLYECLGFRVVGTVPRALKHNAVHHDQHLMARDPADQRGAGSLQSPVA